jgi:general secretion pathway protein J
MQSDCAQIPTAPDAIPNRLPLVVEPGRIVLVRTVHAENQPTRLLVVSYQLKNGTLIRRESVATRDLNALDSLWTAVTNDDSGVPSVVLQKGVAAMTVRIWLNDGNGWRTPGVDVVPTTVTTSTTANAANPAMPTGMEVALQVKEGSMTKVFLVGPV